MTATTSLFQDLQNAIADGRTVTFGTALRAYQIDAKCAKRLLAAGHQPVRLRGEQVEFYAGWSKGRPTYYPATLSNGTAIVGIRIS